MQIEIAIIGFNRSMSFTWPMILRNVIEPLKSKEIDVIINGVISSSKEYIESERNNERGFGETNVPDAERYAKLIELDQAEVDTAIDELFQEFLKKKLFHPGLQDSQKELALLNLLRYLYLQSKYCDLIDEATDLVVFIRPDLLPIDKFYYRKYLEKSESILLPSWGTHSGYNDRFAIIPAFLARKYLNRFTLLPEYSEMNDELHSERFLKWSLQGVPSEEIVVERMPRVRIGGFLATDEEFYIPREYDSRKLLLNSLIYEFVFKIVKIKRRYVAHPLLKFDLLNQLGEKK
jgi:hypothetical protein